MLRRTVFLKLREGAAPDKVEEFERAIRDMPKHIDVVARGAIGKNIARGSEGWTHIMDTLFLGPEVMQAFREHPYHREALVPLFDPGDPRGVVERYEMVQYEPMRVRMVEPAIKDCIKRSLVLQVREGTPQELVERFEKHIMEMPRHIPAIRNWAFSRAGRAIPPSRWTHVWEFEMRDAGGWQEYMFSPFHWAVVDPWFDPEWPQRIVEPGFLNGFYHSPSTILGWQ